jgi:signal transduction histidine kinase
VKSLRGALWALAAAGVLFGVADLALILNSSFIDTRGAWGAGWLVIAWGFVGIGLFAWGRRPDNRVGMLMAVTGFAWLVAGAGFSSLPLVFTLGQLFGAVFFASVCHLLLAFPSGRLGSLAERRIVVGTYLLTTLGVFPLWLFADPHASRLDCDGCPDNVLLVHSYPSLVTTLSTILNLFGAVLVTGVLVVLVKRWRRATPAQRRFLVPVYSAGVSVLFLLIVLVVLQAGGLGNSALDAIWFAAMVPFALVPFLFLGTLIRMRMIQSGAVGELMARLGETPRRGELRDALAQALGDPTLELVYWLPDAERFVDAQGHDFDLPSPGSGRAVTKVEYEGDCVAALVHDQVVEDEQGGYVDAIGAAASLALQNERLEAALRSKVEELRASRERMLSIGLEERRRLERDLHDGAQQRLVSMALNMRLARTRLRDDPAAAEDLLDGAAGELDAALGELRELARGIHPALLSERGLETALEMLARRAPLPVDLGGVPQERLPEAVELAAYFVVAEALTNVAKYAAASRATVDITRMNGKLVVKVEDDGVGGADPDAGTGLRGLADRLAVIEGRLEIDSQPGKGTTITAKIPCA